MDDDRKRRRVRASLTGRDLHRHRRAGIAGYRGIQLLRRSAGSEAEFVTVMWFDSLADVRQFAGEDYEQAVVPPAARALLTRFDERSAHYEVREDRRSAARSA